MAYKYHDEVTLVDVHRPDNFTYANQVSRLVGAGLAAKNVGNLVQQTDNGSFWRVTGVGPVTYAAFTPPAPVVGDIGKSVVVESDGVGGVKFAYDTGGSLWSKTGTVLSPQTSGDTLGVGVGAVGAPGYAFSSDPNTGMYSSGSDTINWSVGGIDSGSMNSVGMSLPKNLLFTGTTSSITLASHTATSGNVVSIKSTPASTSTAVLLRVEADGASWGGGRAVEIVCDNAGAAPLVVNDGAADTLYLMRSGAIQMAADLTLLTGGSILSTANGNISLIPNGTGITKIGTGSPGHLTPTSGELYCQGKAEFDGITYHDAGINSGSINLSSGFIINTNSDRGSFQTFNGSQSTTSAAILTGDVSHYLLVCDYADRNYDFAHAAQTSPTIFIQSENQTADEWLSLAYNKISLEAHKGTSGNVVSVISTPGSSSTAVLLNLEAKGINWGSGARVLKLLSDDNDCYNLAINNGAADVVLFDRQGSIFLTSSGTTKIATTGNADLNLIPNGTGIVKVGTGSPGHLTPTSGEAYFQGAVEIDGVLWTDSTIQAAGSITIAQNQYIGTSAINQGAYYGKLTTQTVNASALTTGAISNHIIICENGDVGYDFAHAQQTNPTVFIQSANQSATEWLSLTHNQTDGVIATGTGTLDFKAGSVTTATVTHDEYWTVKINGVTKNIMLGS